MKILFVWLAILLLKAGDVKLNPGPISSPNSSLSSNPTASFNESITGSGHLSFIHYNVQSIFNKLDILRAEFAELDILAFSESWLNPSIQNSDLSFDSFSQPERKDRDDSHGGVILYVRDSIPYKRRHDLEPTGIECIWVELLLKHKHVLFGLFYRPPNSDADHFAKMENSIHLAVDSNINDVIVTGDFNFNMSNCVTRRKIDGLCQQFSLLQCIDEPTHFTEHSQSIIDTRVVQK